MGLLPESGKVEDVEFFKIDEQTYDPKTMTWGTDWLMKNKMVQEVTIPSDIKAGTYVVRHEIISLHNALNDDYIKKRSGAQFYPQCAKVKVIGDGTATPKGVKFPGGYTWDEKGILVNIFYRANEYISPGPALYKPETVTAPKGDAPVVKETGALSGAEAKRYSDAKARSDSRWEGAVHSTDRARKCGLRGLVLIANHALHADPGGGGCIWDVGADPSTAKCTSMNTANPEYKGFAQPKQSPGYVDERHTDRSVVKFGPIIKYLFDPTQPRWEERAKAGKTTAGKFAARFAA